MKGQKRSVDRVTWCNDLMWPGVTWRDLDDALWWAFEIFWIIQGATYWKRWRIRTCWDSRPARECLLPPFVAFGMVSQGQTGWKSWMLWHALRWKSLSMFESSSSVVYCMFTPCLCVYDYLGLFVSFSALVWLDFAQILRPRSDCKLRRLNQTEHRSFFHGLRFLSESGVI